MMMENLAEEMESERRTLNLMVYRLPENNKDNPDEKK